MSARPPGLGFHSPLTRALPDVRKHGRKLRVTARLTISVIIAVALVIALSAFLVGKSTARTSIFRIVYEFHDQIWLPFWGNLWTRNEPAHLWIWLLVGTLLALVFLSWWSDHSFLLWWHRWLLSRVVRRTALRPLLIVVRRTLPGWLAPEQLVHHVAEQAWLERLIELGDTKPGAATRGRIAAVLDQWEFLHALSRGKEHLQQRDRAVHQATLIAIHARKHPDLLVRACKPFRDLPETPGVPLLSLAGLLEDVRQLAGRTNLDGNVAGVDVMTTLDNTCERVLARANELDVRMTAFEVRQFAPRIGSSIVSTVTETPVSLPTGDGPMALDIALWASVEAGDLIICQRTFEILTAWTVIAGALPWDDLGLGSWQLTAQRGPNEAFSLVRLAQIRACFADLSQADWETKAAIWAAETALPEGWVLEEELKAEAAATRTLGILPTAGRSRQS